MISYFPIETVYLGPVPIRVWGLFVALGFLAGILLSRFLAKKDKALQRHIINLGFWSFLGGIVGSRLLFILTDLKYFFNNPVEIFQIWHGGMSILGGLLLAIFFGFLYVRRHRLNFWKLGDLMAPGLALGLVVGRIGCFLIHDHIGKIMTTPRFWGVNYFGEIRHENALYLIISNALMFVFLLILRHFTKKEGMVFLGFLAWYSLARLCLDFFRDFEVKYLNLTDAQWFSIAILTFLFLYLLFLNSKRKAQNAKPQLKA